MSTLTPKSPGVAGPVTLPRGHDLEAELGRGSVGVVLRAFDRGLARRVAMKRLDPTRAGPRETDRFIAEARLTGGLEHPNILPVHEVATDEAGRPYFTMRLVRGRTFADLLPPTLDPADPAQLFGPLQVFLKACDALRYAHSQGVVHCDLKPQNVMVGEHGEVYLMDWGIARRTSGAPADGPARFATPTSGQVGGIEGTAGFLAPEQADGRNTEIDARTDVYGMGAVLYRIACGRPPIEGGDLATQLARAALGQIDPPSSRVPSRLASIITKALSLQQAARHASIEALQRDVESYLRGGAPPPTVDVPAGTVIIREGEAGESAFLVERGHCLVYRMVGGERRVLGELTAGDVFGETALFAAAPRMASVEAITPTRLASITRASFEEELGRSVWVARCARALAKRFTETQDRLSKAQDERDRAVAEAEILRWLHLKGVPGSSPRRAAWRPLRFQLSRRFGKSPQETEALVQQLTAFEIDVANDELVERG